MRVYGISNKYFFHLIFIFHFCPFFVSLCMCMHFSYFFSSLSTSLFMCTLVEPEYELQAQCWNKHNSDADEESLSNVLKLIHRADKVFKAHARTHAHTHARTHARAHTRTHARHGRTHAGIKRPDEFAQGLTRAHAPSICSHHYIVRFFSERV